MNTLRSIHIPTKEGDKGWVVSLANGEKVFVKASHVFQDETSVMLHNGNDWNTFDLYKDLVFSVERIHMMWFMPNDESLNVLIAAPPEEVYEDETED